MKNFNLNNLIGFIVPALTVVVVVGCIPVAILPELDAIRSKSAVVSQKEDRFQKLADKVNALNKIDSSDLEQKVNNIELALPSGKSVAPLIEGIKKLASDSQLSLSLIKLKPGRVATSSATTNSGTSNAASVSVANQSGAAAAPLPISKTDLLLNVEVKGPIGNYQKFLSLVQIAKRILVVETSSTVVSPDGTATHDIILDAPFQPLQTNFSDVAAQSLPVANDTLLSLYDNLNTNFLEYSQPLTAQTCYPCGVTNPFP